jgi:hypothetical protein
MNVWTLIMLKLIPLMLMVIVLILVVVLMTLQWRHNFLA